MTGVPVDAIRASSSILTGVRLAFVDVRLTGRTGVTGRTDTGEAIYTVSAGSTV